MGIEYDEYRVKIKNKKTREIINMSFQVAHIPMKESGLKELPKKEDLEILDYDIVYG